MTRSYSVSFSSLIMVTLLLFVPLLGNAKEAWPETDADCVRWAAQKRMFLVREVKVFGMNCSIDVSVAAGPDAGGDQRHFIHVTIPHTQFRSGEPERDGVVSDLLGGNAFPNLTFKSDPLNDASRSALQTGTLKSLSGKLSIRGRSFPVVLKLTHKGPHVFGNMSTSMSFFNVKVPKVGGGAVAKVRNTLGLAFRVRKTSL